MHLLYSRFIIKVLYDLGCIGFQEPFQRLFTQGMIIKNGAKMSKSKGNVVSPDELIARYGADTVRLYTLFIGPPEKDAEWDDRAVEGAWRFLNRVWRLVEQLKVESLKLKVKNNKEEASPSTNLRRKTHQTIKKVTDDIEERFHFNTAIAAIMELVNEISTITGNEESELQMIREALETVAILISPFVPHMAEELWEKLGHKGSIFHQPWPGYDEEALKIEETVVVIQVNGKVRSRLTIATGINEEDLKKKALTNDRIKELITGKEVKKVIVVPGKLVNVVVT